jgi:hypothetical protein
MWKEECYHPTTLYNVGLRVNAGHSGGSSCPCFSLGPRNFVVVHVNGIHRVCVDFCGCPGKAPERWRQLMRMKWWPATTEEPRTAFTFEVMRHFEKMNASGHITATNYYRGLIHMSDSTGLTHFPVSQTLHEQLRGTDITQRIVNVSSCWSHVNGAT